SGLNPFCEPTTAPSAESCGSGAGNGVDENCNNQTDEGCVCISGATRQCLTGLVGTCTIGTETCVQNGPKTEWGKCLPNVGPTSEVCGDKLDNDCNGFVDNGCQCNPGSPLSCWTGLPGICATGTATCVVSGDGYGQCVPGTFGPPEVCGDKLDNNCNGLTDEGCGCLAPSTACVSGLPGVCSQGTAQCLPNGSGYGFCVPNTWGGPEVPGNGLDDNCDGVTQ
ncbi:hypothetical protein EPN90_03415, partial [Patescibacteria group bacterium]